MHAVPYLTVPAPEMARPGSPTSLAMALAAHPERWRPLVDYRTDTRWYRLLDRNPHYEVWLLSWLPGQGTDLHDHGAASGAFAVAAGTLTERVLAAPPGRPPVEVTRSLTTGRCRVFGPRYVHQVTNTGSVPAVSVHVYTPGLTVMNCYAAEPSGLHHVAVEQAGVDW
ncbi:MAG TPA: cysteine dioxygenase family protein [Pseudonocardiaceae bacterium]|nr:cysteine dioxygenase family protein [Pseudonocardiaceae bacterium]